MKFTAAIAALAGTSLAAPSVEKRATAINYTQNYNGNLCNFKSNQQAGTFSASWNNPGDFVVGLGWTTGSTRSITFTGTYTTTASSYYTVYGWLNSPLTEYYIVENYSYDPCNNGGTVRGSVTSDGSSYKICTHTQNNQPSIVGTATFGQFFSVRSSKRSQGTVTVANHFAAWKSQAGFQPGNYNYQVMAVEAFGGSGSASVTVAEGTASSAPTSTTTPASSSAPAQSSSPAQSSACTNTITTSKPTTTAAPTTTVAQTTTTAASGANCAAKYGQCGGQGWGGAQCCQSGSTCKASNQYYSQCL